MQIQASECGRVITQQRLPHNLDRRATLPHEFVMKSLQ
jgi:hypothetical protein